LKRNVEINDRDARMLEHLARGASNKGVASAMGYRDGTMRVYLHDLYRKIGVPGRTAAVIWYLGRAGQTKAGRAAASPRGGQRDESFGDMALRGNLLAALGVMNIFLGAHGRVWEVAARLKGSAIDSRTEARRRQSRALWEAFLEGDFAYARELDEGGRVTPLLADSPSDAALLTVLLLLGGETAAADRLLTRFASGRKNARGITVGEVTLLRALRDALGPKKGEAIACVHHLAAERSATPVLRQTAMVALYYAYKARKDRERARATANAIWVEAEHARQHLQAMGERPLYREATLPTPAPIAARTLSEYLRKVSGTKALARQS
jgi:DNA-binding CsgD family transcriptional regulator